jgi:hypothetical protein
MVPLTTSLKNRNLKRARGAGINYEKELGKFVGPAAAETVAINTFMDIFPELEISRLVPLTRCNRSNVAIDTLHVNVPDRH